MKTKKPTNVTKNMNKIKIRFISSIFVDNVDTVLRVTCQTCFMIVRLQKERSF